MGRASIGVGVCIQQTRWYVTHQWQLCSLTKSGRPAALDHMDIAHTCAWVSDVGLDVHAAVKTLWDQPPHWGWLNTFHVTLGWTLDPLVPYGTMHVAALKALYECTECIRNRK